MYFSRVACARVAEIGRASDRNVEAIAQELFVLCIGEGYLLWGFSMVEPSDFAIKVLICCRAD